MTCGRCGRAAHLFFFIFFGRGRDFVEVLIIDAILALRCWLDGPDVLDHTPLSLFLY